ncbi:lipopolysaccharide assembly protein LapB [Desulfopila sp. IMCC35008]|uniref:tetratricopeptide repeat protein n=1 Tax=Desulfopila sp. IMCC35008 TaxID=2653858 RepID=UPI0013D5CA16|nr:tetratricopeptide repeat protein [Desulfopila sp. IMCC35008]
MNKLQDIQSIGPMAGGDAGEQGPIKTEYEKGKKLLEQGKHGEAAVALHNALLGYEEKNDEVGMANASNQLGHLCVAREDFDKAEEHYGRTRELCEKLDDPLSLFALSKVLVDVYIGQKKYDKAINTCLDNLDVYRGNNDPRGAIEVMEKMADIYLLAGQKDKAADTCMTIASIHRNFKHAGIADSFEKKAAELKEAC